MSRSGEQDDLPLFDTALPDLNLVQLFRTNRYVGADRVSDANQVSVGVTSRLFDAQNGAQFLSATLGQTYYFEDSARAPAGRAARATAAARTSSPSSPLTAYKNWNADFGLQWNPDAAAERARPGERCSTSRGPEQVINVGYRFQRDRLEQAEVSTAWPIGQRWNAFARYVYSFQDNKALERFVGLEYRSCCWRMRIAGPQIRQQPHRRAGHGHLPAAGTHRTCQCRIGGGCFPQPAPFAATSAQIQDLDS